MQSRNPRAISRRRASPTRSYTPSPVLSLTPEEPRPSSCLTIQLVGLSGPLHLPDAPSLSDSDLEVRIATRVIIGEPLDLDSPSFAPQYFSTPYFCPLETARYLHFEMMQTGIEYHVSLSDAPPPLAPPSLPCFVTFHVWIRQVGCDVEVHKEDLRRFADSDDAELSDILSQDGIWVFSATTQLSGTLGIYRYRYVVDLTSTLLSPSTSSVSPPLTLTFLHKVDNWSHWCPTAADDYSVSPLPLYVLFSPDFQWAPLLANILSFIPSHTLLSTISRCSIHIRRVLCDVCQGRNLMYGPARWDGPLDCLLMRGGGGGEEEDDDVDEDDDFYVDLFGILEGFPLTDLILSLGEEFEGCFVPGVKERRREREQQQQQQRVLEEEEEGEMNRRMEEDEERRQGESLLGLLLMEWMGQDGGSMMIPPQFLSSPDSDSPISSPDFHHQPTPSSLPFPNFDLEPLHHEEQIHLSRPSETGPFDDDPAPLPLIVSDHDYAWKFMRQRLKCANTLTRLHLKISFDTELHRQVRIDRMSLSTLLNTFVALKEMIVDGMIGSKKTYRVQTNIDPEENPFGLCLHSNLRVFQFRASRLRALDQFETSRSLVPFLYYLLRLCPSLVSLVVPASCAYVFNERSYHLMSIIEERKWIWSMSDDENEEATLMSPTLAGLVGHEPAWCEQDISVLLKKEERLETRRPFGGRRGRRRGGEDEDEDDDDLAPGWVHVLLGGFHWVISWRKRRKALFLHSLNPNRFIEADFRFTRRVGDVLYSCKRRRCWCRNGYGFLLSSLVDPNEDWTELKLGFNVRVRSVLTAEAYRLWKSNCERKVEDCLLVYLRSADRLRMDFPSLTEDERLLNLVPALPFPSEDQHPLEGYETFEYKIPRESYDLEYNGTGRNVLHFEIVHGDPAGLEFRLISRRSYVNCYSFYVSLANATPRFVAVRCDLRIIIHNTGAILSLDDISFRSRNRGWSLHRIADDEIVHVTVGIRIRDVIPKQVFVDSQARKEERTRCVVAQYAVSRALSPLSSGASGLLSDDDGGFFFDEEGEFHGDREESSVVEEEEEETTTVVDFWVRPIDDFVRYPFVAFDLPWEIEFYRHRGRLNLPAVFLRACLAGNSYVRVQYDFSLPQTETEMMPSRPLFSVTSQPIWEYERRSWGIENLSLPPQTEPVRFELRLVLLDMLSLQDFHNCATLPLRPLLRRLTNPSLRLPTAESRIVVRTDAFQNSVQTDAFLLHDIPFYLEFWPKGYVSLESPCVFLHHEVFRAIGEIKGVFRLKLLREGGMSVEEELGLEWTVSEMKRAAAKFPEILGATCDIDRKEWEFVIQADISSVEISEL